MSLTGNFERAEGGRRRGGRLALLLVLVLLAGPSGAGRAQGVEESFAGVWTMQTSGDGETLSVMLGRSTPGGGRDNRYFKLSVSEFSGLPRESVRTGARQVSFQLRRAAGTFDFTGSFDGGQGAGEFTFTPDRGYVERMRREGYGEAVEQNLFGFAISDFSGSPADEFVALGLERPTPEQLKNVGNFGVSARFIGELKALGYQPHSVDQLVNMRLHGVTVEFIRELDARGFARPTLDQLVAARIHGVTPSYIDDLKALGYEPRTLEQLTGLRIHGASIDFIKGLVARGYELPPLDQVQSMRVHGVTHALIDELKALGYGRVPLSQLTDLRIHGVTLDAVRRLNAEGHEGVPLEYLIDVRMFGMPLELASRLPRRGEMEGASGQWRVKFYGRGMERAWAYLKDHTRPRRIESRSFEITPDEWSGLTAAQAFSPEVAQVRFTLRRGDLTLVCTGWFKDGFGAGVFNYADDARKAAKR